MSALLVLAIALDAAAPLPADRARLEANAEGMAGMALGYGHRFDRALLGRDLRLDAGLTLPLFLLRQLDTARLSLGASSRLVTFGRLGVDGGASMLVTTAGNDLGTFVALGAEIELAPGFSFDSWALGLELGVRHQLATHVSHSAYAAMPFQDRYPGASPGPKNGWYANTATRWLLGVQGSVLLGRGISLDGGAGLLLTSQPFGLFLEGMIGLLPFYARLGAAVHFG